MLFGVVNADTAREYEKMIDQQSRNQKEIATLLKEQTSIVNTTSIFSERNSDIIRQNENLLKNSTVELGEAIKTLNKEFSKMQVEIMITDHFTILNILMENLNEQLRDFIDCISQIKTGYLCPLLFFTKIIT